MLSTLKVLIIAVFFISLNLNANDIDKKVIEFEKKRFSKNKKIKLKSVSIDSKKQLPLEGWFGYIVNVTASMKGNEVKAKDIVFANAELISPELFDINGISFKEFIEESLSIKYYDKSKLIAGNHNAKDKIVVFSDPLCPYCISYIPKIINHVKKNEKEVALYYYHFPLLRLHPAAKTLVSLMNVAKAKGIADIELRTYTIDWSNYFSDKERNTKKILDAFNKEFETNITLEDVNDEKISKEIFNDVKLGEDVMVQGTPTIFINGKKDQSKLKFKTLGKL